MVAQVRKMETTVELRGGKMKKLFAIGCTIIVFNVSLNSVQSYADCKDALNKADKVIADQQTLIDLYSVQITKDIDQISSLNVSLNDKNQELASLWRNPWFLGTIGILVGGGATFYLIKR